MRPPSPDDPGRAGGTSHVRARPPRPVVSDGDRQRLRTIALRYAKLDQLGCIGTCNAGKSRHAKVVYPTMTAAREAATRMAAILGYVPYSYRCFRHFHHASK